MSFWPDKTPKSTGNAFDLSILRPSGLDTAQEKAKARRLNPKVETTEGFQTIKGLSKKAQQALKVPTKRVALRLEGGAPGRVPVIPKAQRSRA